MLRGRPPSLGGTLQEKVSRLAHCLDKRDSGLLMGLPNIIFTIQLNNNPTPSECPLGGNRILRVLSSCFEKQRSGQRERAEERAEQERRRAED
jgi:hypothetical protein